MRQITFAEALDALISEYKAREHDLGEMHADLTGAADGLSAEIDEADAE